MTKIDYKQALDLLTQAVSQGRYTLQEGDLIKESIIKLTELVNNHEQNKYPLLNDNKPTDI